MLNDNIVNFYLHYLLDEHIHDEFLRHSISEEQVEAGLKESPVLLLGSL